MAPTDRQKHAAHTARERATEHWETYYRTVLENRPADERCTAFIRAVKADDHAARLENTARRARHTTPKTT